MADEREFIKIICDIIKTEMTLTEEQIWIYNQKRDIPTSEGLFIIVSCQPEDIIGAKTSYESVSEGLMEHQSVNAMARVSVDILSKNAEARLRRHEIIMALRSTFSQQMQEKYSFSIARLPTQFINVSDIEETAILYRFNMSFNVTFKIEKSKLVEYYDKFNKQVITEA